MKSEQISDALDLLDDEMLAHTEALRRKKRGFAGWMKRGALAACVCLVCVTAFSMKNRQPAHKDTSIPPGSGPVEELPPEDAVRIEELLPEKGGQYLELEVLKSREIPIESYTGIYDQVTAAADADLEGSIGEEIPGADGCYRIKGHTDRQYLICWTDGEYSLWKFECFDGGEYPYEEVLRLIYGVDSASAFKAIEVRPVKIDNTDDGKRIQRAIGTFKITDTRKLEEVYQILSGMICYGNDHWDWIDQGDIEFHEAEILGRCLSIEIGNGNVIDEFMYTAVSDMFYEYYGIAYSRLDKEQAQRVCEILEIRGYEGDGWKEWDYRAEDPGEPPAEEKFLIRAERTDASLEYVTELQERVSNAMIEHKLPFVISSSVYENPYRLNIVVTSTAEEDMEKLKAFDTLGGVLEIQYGSTYVVEE